MNDKQKTKAQLLSEIHTLKQVIAQNENSSESKDITEKFGGNDNSFQMLLNDLHVGIVVHDSDTSILYANPAACTLLGLTEEQLYGKKSMDPKWKFFNEDNSEMDLDKYPVNVLLATKEPIETMIIGVNRPANHDVVWLTLNGYVQLDEKGEVGRAVVHFMDISEHRRSQSALAKNQALLAESQRVAKLGGFSFDVKTMEQTWTEETFRILEIDMKGSAPEVPEGVNFIAPEYRPIANEAIQGAIEQGESYDLEWEVITAKDNRKWVRAIGKPNYVNGEVVSISGSFQDITERKQAELKLIESEEKLELALKGADAGLWSWNVKTGEDVLDERWCGILGYKQEEVTQEISSWENLMHPDDKEGIMEVVQKHLEDEKNEYNHEYRLKCKNGNWKWIHALGRIVERDIEGEPVRMAGIILDIAERKEAEAQLEQHQQQLEYLVLERTQELETKNAELDKAMKVFIGRETKILELQKKIKVLLEK